MADTHVRCTVLSITFSTSSGFFNPGLSPSFCLRLRSGRQHPPLSLWLLTGFSLALSCRRLQLLRLLKLRATYTSGITPSAPRPLACFPGDIKATPLYLPRTDHIGLSTYPRDLDQVTDTESHSLTPATTSSHFQVIHPLLPSCTALVRMDHG